MTAVPIRQEASAAPPLRERLRTETRSEHEALDALFEGMTADGDGERYRRFIAMNLAAHRAIEPVLEPVLGAWGWQAGERLAAAEVDAAALGAEPSRADDFPIPHPTLGEAFGIAYVLEGSRLGARFMLKALERRGEGSPGAGLPVRYLSASSDPAPFRALLSAIERASLYPADEADAVRAARATFHHFHGLATLQGVVDPMPS